MISGEGKLLRISISPEILEDVEVLEDAIVAAYQNAWETLQEYRESSIKGLKVPAGLEGMF